jgi:ribonucleoside-triphosphate reductase (formate)
MTNKQESQGCGKETEVYSRVVGFYRPVKQWNNGKREEFLDRKEYIVKK